jgi:hypothetical protein
VRNPFNEYECGSYYARAMASYALLSAISGFRYSAVSKTLWFGPKIASTKFTSFFSAATGFGTIQVSDTCLTVTMVEGELAVDNLRLTQNGAETFVNAKAVARVGDPAIIPVA